ncbi:unnamed protein product [Penicillium nalgiovense]|uniref:CRAL-TRIO domain-containing protein n=1 Tax=Penicillium nalgiovense TaxID=60175 RepID=A0A9W4IRG0_PENNA|nr:unnamed protein product [Penicillium nalgiovense]CAG7935266.1 unnamed protein product [Penicillium nalgiovense]CAG7936152.1 unnamed protein product [Penicillium nalgiovense]CAG7937882.1 unnamed protein product [Penicillium nalgiovense]CAG7938051.1 unnamed protein product [Penicillium nalgiovense]
MAGDGPKPGFLGNISKDQEAKLQTLWSILLKAGEVSPSNEPINGSTEEDFSPTQPQRRLSLLGRTQSNVSEKAIPTPNTLYHRNIMRYLGEIGAGVAESNAIKKALSEITPAELRRGILDTLKHDHPDTLLLRFLRARKWDVPKSFAMLMEAVVWRVKEMHVDDVMAKGELHALKQTQNKSSTSEQKAGNDFLSQMRMGKSYVHGVDRAGRPIVVVRVCLHKPGAQSEESLEQYIVHVIESVRLTLAPPIEAATVLFDMTGFGLSNMVYHREYPPVKFILKCFEANYPECLGLMLIHNAPWVFSGIWRLIRGWMDPEIAAKVEFTNNVADLEKFIPRGQIVEEMGGDEKWSYEYVEPDSTENSRMDDATTRDALESERQAIGEAFLAATSGWINATKLKDATKLQSSESERAYLAERLRVNHWKLDPYVRARLLLDRTNVIQEGGKIEFYPEKVPMECDIETTKALGVEHLEQGENAPLANCYKY